MMNDSPIGFFDSGVGGLSVLRRALEVMPEENYIYFGDSLNAPYGTKSRDKVFKLTENAVNTLVEKGVKAIVIACNTATSICVDTLRRELDIPIISMEPAIKPALENTDGKVLLLATNVTLSSERVNSLIRKYDASGRVIKVPCAYLAGKIEQAVFSHCDIDGYLNELLMPYKDVGATAAVLGCTHYPFVKKRICACLPNVMIFDGTSGTVSHLKEILEQYGIKRSIDKKGSVQITSSKNGTLELYRKLMKTDEI